MVAKYGQTFIKIHVGASLITMSIVQIKINDQLLVPFGGPKWSIERISVVGVSTTGTYLQSDSPLAYIDKSKEQALRLRDFKQIMPGTWPDIEVAFDAVRTIREHLKKKCELATNHERRFLDLYFEFCQKRVSPPEYMSRLLGDRKNWKAPYNDDNWVFEALMPLPQAHLYQTNPLEDDYSFVPSRMLKVDFAFWTGKRLVAVEVDGGSHIGNESHVEKDRLLLRSGVHVVHILNSEITKYGIKVIERLLPAEITEFWRSPESNWRANPLSDIPF